MKSPVALCWSYKNVYMLKAKTQMSSQIKWLGLSPPQWQEHWFQVCLKYLAKMWLTCGYSSLTWAADLISFTLVFSGLWPHFLSGVQARTDPKVDFLSPLPNSYSQTHGINGVAFTISLFIIYYLSIQREQGTHTEYRSYPKTTKKKLAEKCRRQQKMCLWPHFTMEKLKNWLVFDFQFVL